jgi:hypothetical protein
MDRSEEFRRAAADCLALISTTTDASSRVRLLTMAQQWSSWANAKGAERLETALREFNDRQMISISPDLGQRPRTNATAI